LTDKPASVTVESPLEKSSTDSSDDELRAVSSVPQSVREGDLSVPNLVGPAPGPVLTVSTDEIARFFVRERQESESVRWDVRLDAALREILELAHEFVPSEAGGILLDDPRAKRGGNAFPRLTIIASYGAGSEDRLGQRVPSDRGFIGNIYSSGQSRRASNLEVGDPLIAFTARGLAAARPIASVIGVPVIVGESICGVLYLTNRQSGGPYGQRDSQLLRTFAGYMSSSIQNALDAIRARALLRLDHLTGLYNSRYLHTRLQDEIERADSDGAELSLLFLDLDNFKHINDRLGHLAGSWALREVSRVLQDRMPPASVLARYGGDEFVVLLPGSTIEQALATAETLRTAIADLRLFEDEDNLQSPSGMPPLGCSIGAASYREHLAPGGSKRHRENALLGLADTAMYRAKARGRNRVCVADAEE